MMEHSKHVESGNTVPGRERPGASAEETDVDYARQMDTRLGFWAAVMTAAFSAVALAVAVTTPPRSGPYCRSGCISYPFTDVAEYVPRDYLWMYPAILGAIAFVVLAASVHSSAPDRWKGWTLAGTSLAVVAAGALVIDYGLQLSVVQPSLLAGETSDLSLLSQYNPHGIFIGLENLGYAMLALAAVFLGVPLANTALKAAPAAGRVLFLGGVLALGLLAFLGFLYQEQLEYRFEVLGLLVMDLVLVVSGALLAVAFFRPRPMPYERRDWRGHHGKVVPS
ncbi:hypothetical protein DQ353_14090 [Arthrobacter sp. AQ5-05]|uniref:hypothetical protein n=1 Tax=Arthrobacter sp. AQ5-05 TaxID=2184581 RepID=UPI000DCE74E1|nr:hypothetical protein [Arthrobacter sp. AQ5-05]RAX48660.1 hypothetical protein DQ353_14090 [Arthrobacter sp. AQ5-05]